MLILTRRAREDQNEIIITDTRSGETIKIVIMGVVGNQARVGIDAPRHFQVDRLEIFERKDAEAKGLPPPERKPRPPRQPRHSRDADGNVASDDDQFYVGVVAVEPAPRPAPRVTWKKRRGGAS